jgi:rare lipoprotein A
MARSRHVSSRSSDPIGGAGMSRKALFAAALTVVSFEGWAQSPTATDMLASFAERWWPLSFAQRWGTLAEPLRTAPAPSREEVLATFFSLPAEVSEARAALPPSNTQTEKQTGRASYGLASYYWQGQRTASGERFNKRELTAAHRTLPFGTRVQVTNLATGRSVTVRVNDRGPFIAGRVIDVSQAAAEELGMVDRGVTKVKLSVVQ